MNFFWELIFDTLFPRKCLLCGQQKVSLCALCLKKLPRSDENNPGYISLLSYKDKNTRHVLHALKYKGDKKVYDALHDIYLSLLKEKSDSDLQRYIITSIPMRTTAKRTRRVDHVSYIAKKIGESLEIPYEKILFWRHDSGSQVKKSTRKKRMLEMKGALCATSIALGKKVIVIDDIATTGATLTEAKRALKNAGAKKVCLAVVAH